MAAQVLKPQVYEPSVKLEYNDPEPVESPLAFSFADSQLRLDDIVQEAIRLARSGELDTLLNKHGAVYFKGLGLKDAGKFSEFAHAFGWVPHEDIGNPVRRTVHAKNVASANEGPNTQPVYPHNEFGLSPHYPSYVLFYCVTAPETGT
jgi:alpha-ketoglutarate-dependent taurine dioxygenase